MQKIKCYISVILCLVLIFLTVSACKNTSGEGSLNGDPNSEVYSELLSFKKRKLEGDTNITVLCFQTSGADNLKNVAAMYKSLYGGDIEYVNVSWSNRFTELSLLKTADRVPDVLIGFGENDFPKFINIDVFAKIDDSNFDFNNEIIDKASVNSMLSYNGRKYGIAVKDSPEVVIYNKEYFANRGITTPYELYLQNKWDWSTLKETAKKLSYDSDDDGVIDHYGLCAWSLKSLFASNNTWPITKTNDKATINLGSKEVKETLQLIYDMVNIDKSMPKNIYTAETGFLSGNVAMYIERPYIINSYINSGMSAESIEIAPVPKGYSSDEYISFVSPRIYGVGSSCKNKSAALGFLECYLSLKAPKKNSSGGGYATKQQNEMMRIIRDNKKLEYVPTGYGTADTVLTSLYTSIAKNTTVEEAIVEYSAKLEAELNFK